MSRRAWIGAGIALAAIAGILVAYDALVVTEEERLEAFVDDVTGMVTQGRVRGARSRWVDLGRQPLEVSAMGQSLLYREGEEEELAAQSRRALRSMLGTSLRVVSSSIRIEGDTATVDLRLMSRERGFGQAQWRLRRHGEDWLIERLSVRR